MTSREQAAMWMTRARRLREEQREAMVAAGYAGSIGWLAELARSSDRADRCGKLARECEARAVEAEVWADEEDQALLVLPRLLEMLT